MSRRDLGHHGGGGKGLVEVAARAAIDIAVAVGVEVAEDVLIAMGEEVPDRTLLTIAVPVAEEQQVGIVEDLLVLEAADHEEDAIHILDPDAVGTGGSSALGAEVVGAEHELFAGGELREAASGEAVVVMRARIVNSQLRGAVGHDAVGPVDIAAGDRVAIGEAQVDPGIVLAVAGEAVHLIDEDGDGLGTAFYLAEGVDIGIEVGEPLSYFQGLALEFRRGLRTGIAAEVGEEILDIRLAYAERSIPEVGQGVEVALLTELRCLGTK